jgi:hypothetical protein
MHIRIMHIQLTPILVIYNTVWQFMKLFGSYDVLGTHTFSRVIFIRYGARCLSEHDNTFV